MAGKKHWQVPHYYCQYYRHDIDTDADLCRCTEVTEDTNNEKHQNTTGKCNFNQCPIRKRKLDIKKLVQNMPKVRESVVSRGNVSQIDVKKESE